MQMLLLKTSISFYVTQRFLHYLETCFELLNLQWLQRALVFLGFVQNFCQFFQITCNFRKKFQNLRTIQQFSPKTEHRRYSVDSVHGTVTVLNIKYPPL